MYPGIASTSPFEWPLRWAFPAAASAAGAFSPNTGWTFGNIVINSTNSSSPGVEQAVVSRHSYGRQLGRLLEAVEAIAAKMPQLKGDARIVEFLELAKEVREVKAQAQSTRLDNLREELRQLKARDPRAWQEIVKSS